MTSLFTAIFFISSIALIISVLLQDSKSEGMGAIGGGANTSFSRSNSRSLEAILSKVTTVSAVVFMLSALILAAL